MKAVLPIRFVCDLWLASAVGRHLEATDVAQAMQMVLDGRCTTDRSHSPL